MVGLATSSSTTPQGASASPPGVFYHPDDYAGLFRRIAIDVIDFALVGVTWALIDALGERLGLPRVARRVCMALVAWLYLAALKVTPMSTAGYRLLGMKLVDLQGKPVKLWKATLRSLMIVFGPASVVFDVIWLTGDENRQTLRDKIAGTYVVRSDATPMGQGAISYRMYFVAGLSLVIPEVVRPGVPQQRRG